MTLWTPTRRRLLGFVGGAAAVGVAGASSVAAAELGAIPATEQASIHVNHGTALDVRWAHRDDRSGRRRSRADVNDANGAIPLHLEGVMPGDAGRLVTNVTPRGESLAVTLSVTLTENRENGLTEPEAKAGDAAADGGELADALDVAVWYDTGVLAGVGHSDGHREPTETTLSEGSLTDVAETLTREPVGGSGALPADHTVPVTLAWQLPSDVGNAVQTDSVSFSLAFHAETPD